MSDYSEFFLSSNSKVAQLELLQLSHPNLTQTYYIVRNSRSGVTVTLETAASQFFTYYPVRIKSQGQRDDLDQGFSITIGDVGKVLPAELDAIEAATGWATKPTLKYRTYRSDILSKPLFGPVNLEVKKITTDRQGSTFIARAPQLNSSRTGELYRLDRFPMLRGTL